MKHKNIKYKKHNNIKKETYVSLCFTLLPEGLFSGSSTANLSAKTKVSKIKQGIVGKLKLQKHYRILVANFVRCK